MRPKSAIAKGKVLENWVAEQLRHSGLDPTARREIGSGSGRFKGDIATKLPLTFECKNTQKFSPTAFYKQADDASMGYQDPIVVWHPPRTPLGSSKVMMSWDMFIRLAKAFFVEK